uniref:Uncharacterized protein n=1 Tax=Kalanchoe fedtschenkoi TaxID=63787 RepID=A0A7N0V914_KALFE
MSVTTSEADRYWPVLLDPRAMAPSSVLLLVSNPFFPSFTCSSTSRTEFGLSCMGKVMPGHTKPCLAVRCISVENGAAEPVVARRSANYTECLWDYDYIQSSMRNDYNDEKFKMQMEELKQQVVGLLGCISGQAEQLELIDDLQRLGVAYHFEKEIKSALNRIYYKMYVFDENQGDADLHVTALAFRLFRQHSYAVPQDVFKHFLNGTGNFESRLCADIRGLVSLYEASYLSADGEAIMEEALAFTTASLREVTKQQTADSYLDAILSRALDMPLHWRTARTEARWYVEEAYGKKPNMSPLLHQFAKLDFNIVQATYREELRDLSRWWKKLRFDKDLSFAGDCLVVSYVWGIMASSEPQHAASRTAFAKIIALVSTVDDVYDLHATPGESELITNAFERWDIDSMRQLPHYMKKCYLACYNCVNEMAYDVLNQKGSDVTPSLKKAWAILTRSYLKEARWFHSGHKPTLDEYMSNAWLTISIPLVSLHGHIYDTKPLVEKQVQYLESHPEILKWSCITFRLCDDLGTSSDEMARGDTPKAIQCFMNDTGASEQAAREHVEKLVREGWKKMNQLRMEERILPAVAVERLFNLTRAAHCFYQHGDGHGIQDGVTKQLMSKLLFDSIPM